MCALYRVHSQIDLETEAHQILLRDKVTLREVPRSLGIRLNNVRIENDLN